MLALTIIADPAARIGSSLFFARLRDALEEHPGDVPIVVQVGARRLLLGTVYTVEPCLELEAKLRDLRLDLGPDQEVLPWRSSS
jgi:hypothetical protein